MKNVAILCPGPSLMDLDPRRVHADARDAIVAVTMAITYPGVKFTHWCSMEGPRHDEITFPGIGKNLPLTIWSFGNAESHMGKQVYTPEWQGYLKDITWQCKPTRDIYEDFPWESFVWEEYSRKSFICSTFGALMRAIYYGAREIDVFGADCLVPGNFDPSSGHRLDDPKRERAWESRWLEERDWWGKFIQDAADHDVAIIRHRA